MHENVDLFRNDLQQNVDLFWNDLQMLMRFKKFIIFFSKSNEQM